MAIVLDVTLISGRRVSLEAGLGSSVRRALGVGNGRLFNSSGLLVDGDATLEAAGFQTGDCLTLQVGKVQICGGLESFAAILADGSVDTWGVGEQGGDSSEVQEQLKNVQQIQATRLAFAAIRGDRSVLTWSHASAGADSSAVQDQLCKRSKPLVQLLLPSCSMGLLSHGATKLAVATVILFKTSWRTCNRSKPITMFLPPS